MFSAGRMPSGSGPQLQLADQEMNHELSVWTQYFAEHRGL